MSKQLTLSDRIRIESGLNNKLTLGEIARSLNKSVSSISREIKRHRIKKHIGKYRIKNNCRYYSNCSRYHLCANAKCYEKCKVCNLNCTLYCDKYEPTVCPRLTKAPYVCNGCTSKTCHVEKYYYYAEDANKQYRKTLVDKRIGFNLTEAELENIDKFFTERIKKGQSIYNIINCNKNEIPCSQSTAYRLINSCEIGIRRIDLPRAARFKIRKGIKPICKVDKNCTINRKYDDYIQYCDDNPDIVTAEIDSVIGRAGGKVLHTIILDNISFMLAYISDRNTAQSVIDIFNELKRKLPLDLYKKMFGLLLADNGSEFSNPGAIEINEETGEIVSRVFYCNPSSPYEKPQVENNHTLLRRIIPKGSSFDEYTQKDIDLMMSHVNSYGRAKYNGKSPTSLFIELYGEKVLRLLRQELISAEEIILKPELLTK